MAQSPFEIKKEICDIGKRPILAYALFGDLLMKIVKKNGQKINDF